MNCIKENNPLISLIMPVYNDERHIKIAIDSVLNQSYSNWELIIVDDCSTDDTVNTIKAYNDSRIKLFTLNKNSGGAFYPRQIALNYAKAEFICTLDSDDFLEPLYFEKMINRIISKRADICCSQLIKKNNCGKKTVGKLPLDNFDSNSTFSGKEAYFKTVPEYLINLNGALIKAELWKKALTIYKTEICDMYSAHDDENLGRIILLEANVVVFSDAIYYYIINPNSVTHIKFSANTLNFRDSNRVFRQFLAKHYTIQSSEYLKFDMYDYIILSNLMISFFKNCLNISYSDFVDYYFSFSDWYVDIKNKVIGKNPYLGCIKRNILFKLDSLGKKNFILFFLTRLVLASSIRSFIRILLFLLIKSINSLKNNKLYKWYYILPESVNSEESKIYWNHYSTCQ